MVEPMSAAAAGLGRAAGAALGKAVRPSGRIRLGGREERREVYAHFQSCVINTFMSMYRHTEWAYLRYTPLFHAAQHRSADRVLDAQAAMQDALAELLLVGNDKPRQAGFEAAMVAVAVNVKRGPKARMNSEKVTEFWDCVTLYVEACQEDLWYLPRWWQLWRPAWWSTRWRSLSARWTARKERKHQPSLKLPSTPQTHQIERGTAGNRGESNPNR